MVWRRSRRHAMIPVVIAFGIYILTMLSGSISIELVFNRSRLGTGPYAPIDLRIRVVGGA